MKLILLSDLHLRADTPIGRLDNTPETQMEKLKFVLNYARENKIEYVLQAGDFFHSPRSYRALSSATWLLSEYPEVKVLAIFGQHDMYFRSSATNNTSLGILREAGLVKDISREQENLKDPKITIYGWSYGDTFIKGGEGTQILVIHMPILMKKGWGEQTDFHYAPEFLRTHERFDLILCGDIHQKFMHREGDRIICNTGPLLRAEASWNMMEHKPCFFIYDTEKKNITEVSIPHKPAEEVLSRDHIESKERRELMLEGFTSKLEEGEEVKGDSFKEVLDSLIKKEGVSEEVVEIISEIMEEEDE